MEDGYRLRLDVFGRRVQVVRDGQSWTAYESSGDGKRRRMQGMVIPAELSSDEVVRYIADICHEWASPKNPHVITLPD